MRIHTFLIFWIFVSVPIIAQQAPDLKPNTKHNIVFSARPPGLTPFSLGGHAFVTWNVTGPEDSSILNSQTYGFYPYNELKFTDVADNVKGKVVAGYEKNRNGHPSPMEVMVEVNDSVYVRALNTIKKWQNSDYNLCENNCLSFLDDIAESVGLRTPKTKSWIFFPKTPDKYLKQLYRKNTKTRVVEKNWYKRLKKNRYHPESGKRS